MSGQSETDNRAQIIREDDSYVQTSEHWEVSADGRARTVTGKAIDNTARSSRAWRSTRSSG